MQTILWLNLIAIKKVKEKKVKLNIINETSLQFAVEDEYDVLKN